ncbi:hypothetical protein P7K49_020852 [Saguinus oedipus]|uniref:Uncharacterized protein n=1 Tax=Saguinus oedipus TaxID=9490 RepID=A0ABQ9URR4_SAGOE|nr:hypothetical protein P7K49_020852 [Saguinus oedipus]
MCPVTFGTCHLLHTVEQTQSSCDEPQLSLEAKSSVAQVFSNLFITKKKLDQVLWPHSQVLPWALAANLLVSLSGVHPGPHHHLAETFAASHFARGDGHIEAEQVTLPGLGMGSETSELFGDCCGTICLFNSKVLPLSIYEGQSRANSNFHATASRVGSACFIFKEIPLPPAIGALLCFGGTLREAAKTWARGWDSILDYMLGG